MNSRQSAQANSLAILEFSSIADGYHLVNDITLGNDSLRVLDLAPAGGHFAAVLMGGEGAVRECQTQLNRLRPSLVDSAFISHCDLSLRDALFALTETQLQDSLLVSDFTTLSHCMLTAQSLVAQHQLQAIEIRLNRAGGGIAAHGFFTGSRAACEQAAAANANDPKTHTRALSEPSGEIRRLFQFTQNNER